LVIHEKRCAIDCYFTSAMVLATLAVDCLGCLFVTAWA